jgi:hypothetical protein
VKVGREWWVLAIAVVPALGLALLAMTLASAGATARQRPPAGSLPATSQGAGPGLEPASGPAQPGLASQTPSPVPEPTLSLGALSPALLKQQLADAKPCPTGVIDPGVPVPPPSTAVVPPLPGQPGAKICIFPGVPTVTTRNGWGAAPHR